jgi:hypothetical protein
MRWSCSCTSQAAYLSSTIVISIALVVIECEIDYHLAPRVGHDLPDRGEATVIGIRALSILAEVGHATRREKLVWSRGW